MNLVDRETVSIPRACELVSVSRRTIYNWISSGKVQYVRTAGGSVRIFADTLWRDPAAVSPKGEELDRRPSPAVSPAEQPTRGDSRERRIA
ncbi:MAG: helix-turn-helix domain-containing protein [Acidobacteria bacterium]|nr:MAG: helix-turn-helix domain-containing protein [Acidobacteriota bacterium]